MLKPLLLSSALIFSAWASAEVRTFRDVMDREVSVDVPVKRPIITFYYPDYIAVAGIEGFSHVVGISREFWEKFNPGSWQLYSEKMPKLQEITDVGYPTNSTFSTEKALSLKPDVLIVPKVQMANLEADLPHFEKLGIPVVVVDFNDQTIDNHKKSVELFGILSGQEERAKQIAEEYEAGILELQKRVTEAGKAKPKIYVEFGNKGPSEYSFTFGKNMWGAVATTVGGDNISAPFVENWGQISAEQFLTSNPDVVIITGTENNIQELPEIMAMGIDVSAEEAQKRLNGFKARQGWENIEAVKNNRVFGLYHTASRSISDLAAAQFIAKALYPDLFQDLDPLKTYLSFHEKYLPITPNGTFFLTP
ncbi:MAG: ABC transporter substrate-binding protein [Cardiobacteriaceae bacterium]|nr:ABC transporter substrate-binding protein [Cardiobacteriaceae bacterium]